MFSVSYALLCDAYCALSQALITFLYVDFLDATGTLFSMVQSTLLHFDMHSHESCGVKCGADFHCIASCICLPPAGVMPC